MDVDDIFKKAENDLRAKAKVVLESVLQDDVKALPTIPTTKNLARAKTAPASEGYDSECHSSTHRSSSPHNRIISRTLHSYAKPINLQPRQIYTEPRICFQSPQRSQTGEGSAG